MDLSAHEILAEKFPSLLFLDHEDIDFKSVPDEIQWECAKILDPGGAEGWKKLGGQLDISAKDMRHFECLKTHKGSSCMNMLDHYMNKGQNSLRLFRDMCVELRFYDVLLEFVKGWNLIMREHRRSAEVMSYPSAPAEASHRSHQPQQHELTSSINQNSCTCNTGYFKSQVNMPQVPMQARFPGCSGSMACSPCPHCHNCRDLPSVSRPHNAPGGACICNLSNNIAPGCLPQLVNETQYTPETHERTKQWVMQQYPAMPTPNMPGVALNPTRLSKPSMHPNHMNNFKTEPMEHKPTHIKSPSKGYVGHEHDVEMADVEIKQEQSETRVKRELSFSDCSDVASKQCPPMNGVNSDRPDSLHHSKIKKTDVANGFVQWQAEGRNSPEPGLYLKSATPKQTSPQSQLPSFQRAFLTQSGAVDANGSWQAGEMIPLNEVPESDLIEHRNERTVQNGEAACSPENGHSAPKGMYLQGPESAAHMGKLDHVDWLNKQQDKLGNLIHKNRTLPFTRLDAIRFSESSSGDSSLESLRRSCSTRGRVESAPYSDSLRTASVFITHLHQFDKSNHKQKLYDKCVLSLGHWLKDNSFRVQMDVPRLERIPDGEEDWREWIDRKFQNQSTYIIVCLSPSYLNIIHAANIQDSDVITSNILSTRYFYHCMQHEIETIGENRRFIPVLFDDVPTGAFPYFLQRTKSYRWTRDFQDLIWRLSQPEEGINNYFAGHSR